MTTNSLSDTVLADAATAVAEAFGLGDSAEVGKSWLVDDGDTVIVAQLAGGLTGGLDGELMLAVNADVGKRLTSDPARLSAGLGNALAVLSAALGAAAEFGDITSAPAMSLGEPTHRVEIRDKQKLCALLGVTLVATAVTAEPLSSETPAEPLAAAAFDPAPFTEQPINAEPSVLTALGPLALLQDVDMEVTVELGRTTMPIRDLLALQPGMVVEIDRVAGAPIDVLVNGRRFACGEVVVIDEEFGLRITEIVGAS